MTSRFSLIAVFVDEIRLTRCRDRACGRQVFWAEVVKSGKKLLINGNAVAVSSTVEDVEGRQRRVQEFTSDDVHWASCPGAKRFRKRKAR